MTKSLLLFLANRLSSHRCRYRRQSRRGKAAFAVFSPRFAAAAAVAGNDANDDGRDDFKNETKKTKKKKSEKKKNIDETKLFIAGGG